MSNREKELEDALVRVLKPLADIPFEVVIRAIYDQKVHPYDVSDNDHSIVLESMAKAARTAAEYVRENPIYRPRPNEVGNDMEEPVINALNQFSSFKASRPKTRQGSQKSTGYPDIMLRTMQPDIGKIYVEVKTYKIDVRSSTLRSFYLSPATDPKVIYNARHLVFSFEMEDQGPTDLRDDSGRVLNQYVPNAYTIVDLYGLHCDMKYEIQSDNLRLYDNARVLKQERLD